MKMRAGLSPMSSAALRASRGSDEVPHPTMKLAVLNPGGNDPEQHFPDFAGVLDERAHPPVNFHAFAACTGGVFYRKDQVIPAESKSVLLLLRRDLKECRQSMIDLRRAGKTVAISFKESGAMQIAALLAKPARLRLFHEICARADGAIAVSEELVPLYRGAGVRQVEFIPTPYPVEDDRWNFSANTEHTAGGESHSPSTFQEPRGIFLGTREFDVASRNHLAALLTLQPLAEAMGEPVTVFNVEGWWGRRMLAQVRYPEGLLRVIEGRLPYPRYLRLMAQHKIVFQLDASAVPGQVAGDALLSRVPCIGGNGTTERLVFPDLCGHGRTSEQLFDIAARLLEHPHDRARAVEQAIEFAQTRLSFARVAKQVESFFRSIART
jgi:hypothetical protein